MNRRPQSRPPPQPPDRHLWLRGLLYHAFHGSPANTSSARAASGSSPLGIRNGRRHSAIGSSSAREPQPTSLRPAVGVVSHVPLAGRRSKVELHHTGGPGGERPAAVPAELIPAGTPTRSPASWTGAIAWKPRRRPPEALGRAAPLAAAGSAWSAFARILSPLRDLYRRRPDRQHRAQRRERLERPVDRPPEGNQGLNHAVAGLAKPACCDKSFPSSVTSMVCTSW